MEVINQLSEKLERLAIKDLVTAASPELRENLGVEQETIESTLVSVFGKDPTSIVLNRAIGMGVSIPASLEEVKDVIAAYQRAQVQRYFIHLHPAAQPQELKDWLTQEGLEKARAWMKFYRERTYAPTFRSKLKIKRIDHGHAKDFARIAGGAFDLSPQSEPLLVSLVGRSKVHVYMSFQNETPVGCGAMFVHDDCAWFDWGATLPEFRSLGSQHDILCQRICDAMDLGCHYMFTCTGEAVEGDPQHSYHNIERVGFKPFCLRENYQPVSQN